MLVAKEEITMNKTGVEITNNRKLSEIFEDAFDLYHSFETRKDATNSTEFQVSLELINFEENNYS